MRAHLGSSPCTDELIEPIIQWIYHGESINRQHFEDYMDAFEKTTLVMRRLRLGNDRPDSAVLVQLFAKYGSGRNFRCSSISAVFRKLPDDAAGKMTCRAYWGLLRRLDALVVTFFARLRFAVGTVFFDTFPFLGHWYSALLRRRRGA